MNIVNQKKEEIKEPFCGACIAGVAALAGAGTAGGSTSSKNKTTKKIIFWTGVGVSIMSILILVYLLCFKNCNQCR
jgi:hypothetical protein